MIYKAPPPEPEEEQDAPEAEASLTIAADQADSMPVSPSSPCSGIHNRLHGPLHRLVVDRIDVGEFGRDRL